MISIQLSASVMIVELRRPDKLNAVNPEMVTGLLDAFGEAEDQNVHALVLQGLGRSFCAGRDIDAPWGTTSARQLLATTINPLILGLYRLPMPTLSVVQGHCIGLGLGLALACDMTVAADTARFVARVAGRGSLADSAAHLLVPRRTGIARGADLLWTGRALSGLEAAQCGLVSRSVPEAELEDARDGMVASLTTCPPDALRRSKSILRRFVGADATDVGDVLDAEAMAAVELLAGRGDGSGGGS